MSEPNAEILVSVELLRMIIDLPPCQRIVGARTDRDGYIGLLLVCEELPSVSLGDPLHLVTPIMEKVCTGETRLKDLQVTPSGERGKPLDASKLKL